MPSADMTTTVDFWPLRTRAEMCSAMWEIVDSPFNAAASIVNGFDSGGAVVSQLQVMTAGQIVIPHDTASMGDVVVVRSAAGWETMTVSAALARGLPIDDMPET
ncbi:hypothetical protein H7K45_27675 [Mycobacterium yunnanensis]|uniref:Uncharacterized protein n=1 Tax=Mycobacterium yunnanensis TaxID=368477 RepID=A0A9X2YRL9_9MYCO|nr:hypothetical protein [Mycobacterium yunnanensis]MCV7424332.1 hypothetical protein [Mycobacterium yunnanensis]